MNIKTFSNNWGYFREYQEVTNDELFDALADCTIIKKGKISYINAPVAFDIETSSFYNNGRKNAIMYVWQIDINGLCIYGRTWEQYKDLCARLVLLFELGEKLKIIIYVHNLAYEFQFFRKQFNWRKVFAREERKPMYAETEDGIIYKCSYLLSGYSLEKVADNLSTYKIKKLTGELDYSLIRHTATVLTESEKSYMLNDVKIIEYYIREEIERNGDITKIPLTQTGYVRRYMRNCCYPDDRLKYKKFFELIKNLTLSVDEYKLCKCAFQGGFTHANAYYVGRQVEDVSSIDFTSSYPYAMVSEQFPMSCGELIEIKSYQQLKELSQIFCLIFDVIFFNLEPKIFNESYLSESKCKCKKTDNYIVNNGRIVSAEVAFTTLTNVDLEIIERCYCWEDIKILKCYKYHRQYLPTPFVKGILKLYEDKTKLKGVSGKEIEYLHSKEQVNSAYGMTVTDIAPDEIIYDENWNKRTSDLYMQLSAYNNARQRFLFYPWGIFVTAYARRNLFTGILEFNSDYIYSDTDSLKVRNINNHRKYIEEYNQIVLRKLKKAAEHHKLDFSLFSPATIKGVQKPLGVWDDDGEYTYFKTLGAKRYMYTDKKDGDIHITVAGVQKKAGADFFKNNFKNPYDGFNFECIIPEGKTGKNILTYIDDEISGEIIDYMGKVYDYNELSCIHMEPTSYAFYTTEEFLSFIQRIKEERH